MNNKAQGLLYILTGFACIFFAGEVILRVALAVFGIYLIINGLRLRNPHQFFSYSHLFSNRRPPF